jgi:hypothetical protein
MPDPTKMVIIGNINEADAEMAKRELSWIAWTLGTIRLLRRRRGMTMLYWYKTTSR